MTTSPVMRWLADGVPLTLLCDLASTQDPQSRTLYLDEPHPADVTAVADTGADHAGIDRMRAV